MNKTKANLIANRIISSMQKIGTRPYLEGAWAEDALWYVTDTFRAIRFKDNWGLPESKCEKKDYTIFYETAKIIIAQFTAFAPTKDNELTVPTLEEIKFQITEQKNAKVKVPTITLYGRRDKKLCAYVNAAYLKDMVELYGDKNIQAFYDGEIRHPVYFTDGHDDAILMTIRK